jgi:alkylation response protein AidB-like acyl-CoA dehydrogenase
MVGKILQQRAAEPVRTQWLSTWGSPESFAAFALSEAGAGSDAAAVRVSARIVEGGYRINGEKMWVTNGLTGRWLLTLVRLDGASDDEALCAVLVDATESGIERTPIHGKMGIRGSETAVISFTDTFVPEEHLIGERGRGLDVFLTTLNHGRVGIATQGTGIAEACLDEMVSYARQREQFGRPIGRFQAVANMLADSAVELEASKALVWRAARKIEAGETDRCASSMAKAYATDAANRIAYRAVQVHGGTGYVRECRVEQLYRDARVTTIYEGTSEIQRIVIARELARP